MKRQLLFVISVLMILTLACGSQDGTTIPTPGNVPEANETPTPDESPRIGPDSDLPPTWTPIPTNAPPTPQIAGEGEATGETNTEGQETYVVQPGDTLAEIAAAYGVTVEALVEANNIADIDVIEVDQVLIIPR
jgi:LysM repeat protein